jgi:hypothetical protein
MPVTTVSGRQKVGLVSSVSVFRRPFTHLRTKLLVSMFAVVFLLTAAVLVLVQARMSRHVREDLVSTLHTESSVYTEIQRARREQEQQSAVLIADQPSLKALMSTDDPQTVQDASEPILLTSRADLLILENPRGGLLAFHSKSGDVTSAMVKPLLLSSPGDEDWWFTGSHLYDVNFVSIVAGAGSEARVLGRMALGREIKRDSILKSGALGKSQFTFERDGHVLLSSLPPDVWVGFERQYLTNPLQPPRYATLTFTVSAIWPAFWTCRAIIPCACSASSPTIRQPASCTS